MKKFFAKIANILKIIYGYGMTFSIFVGGLTALGYFVALIVGGNAATLICEFIYNQIYPILIYATSILVIVGLLKMYFLGEAALTVNKKEASKRTE